MSEREPKPAQQGRRMHRSEYYEVGYWPQKFGFTPRQFREALNAESPVAAAVQRGLRVHAAR